MEVFDGLPSRRVYISWWPMTEVYEDLKSDPERSHLVSGFNPIAPGLFMARDQSDDVRLHGGRTPAEVTLAGGLDETNIKSWWRRRMADSNALYMASNGNCAATVYMALLTGGSYQYTPWRQLDRPSGNQNRPLFSEMLPDPESTRYPLVTPADVLEYSRAVQQGLMGAGWGQPKTFPIVNKIKDVLIRKAVQDALDDNGKLSLPEVKLVCKAALDKGGVSKQELVDLKRLYKSPRTMDAQSKAFLRTFILKHD
jgi:hypothetical protein